MRERFAHRYHNQTLFGMYPRNRRGESSRRGVNSGSSLDRAAGGIGSRRLFGMKLVEADGAPLVDSEALKSIIRLFHVVQVYVVCGNIIVLLLDGRQQGHILD